MALNEIDKTSEKLGEAFSWLAAGTVAAWAAGAAAAAKCVQGKFSEAGDAADRAFDAVEGACEDIGRKHGKAIIKAVAKTAATVLIGRIFPPHASR